MDHRQIAIEPGSTTGRRLLDGDRLDPVNRVLQPEVRPRGERDIDLLPVGVRRVMDLKAPGSGEEPRNRWDNIGKLRLGDEVKIVCLDRADFDWAVRVVKEHALLEKVPVMVSPVFGQLEAKTLAAWVLEIGLDLRLSTQLHKERWGETPGV